MKTVGPVIDGKEIHVAEGKIFNVIDPSTGEVIAHENCCTEACINQMVASSKAAFESAGWQNTEPSMRGRYLMRLADLIEERAEELIELELLDTGKPYAQLKDAEIPLTTDIIRFYAGAADKIEGRVKSTSGGSFHFTLWEPYGVVTGILPWNYPLVNIAMKAAPAVAAGNAIILKPSVDTPLTAVAFAKLCVEAGLPPGIVNVALGSGSKTGQMLITHPDVKKISFTGSTAVGQQIQKQAVDQMKAVNLELGGKNAMIVFADADLEKAADAAIISAFINAGQLCVSCSRLLVESSVAAKFEGILKKKMEKLTTGDPRNTDTLVGPMITKAQYDTALEYIEIAKNDGCRVMTGGKTFKPAGRLAHGFWIEPTILTGVDPASKVATEEIFGPVLSVIPFKDEADAVSISNSVIYGLSGSVWTKNGPKALRMVKALETGIIWVNAMLNGYPQIPVPPHKMSGTGVELGMEGLLKYCKQKSAVMAWDDQSPVGWNL